MAEEENSGQEKAKVPLPFASAEGLRKVIEHVNMQQDRINSLALINVELTKLLVASGHLDRANYLSALDAIADSQSRGNSEQGAKYTQILREIIERQTTEKPSGKA